MPGSREHDVAGDTPEDLPVDFVGRYSGFGGGDGLRRRHRHVGRVIKGSTADSEFWLLAELAAVSVGPLVLGAFLLAALWLRGRAVAIVALATAIFCLCAALVIAAKESFLEMAPVLLYAVALIAYFGAAVRQAPSTPGEPG